MEKKETIKNKKMAESKETIKNKGPKVVPFDKKKDFHLEEALQRLPDKPGVYIMRDENDKVIYVGKAKSLKARVRQYFQPASAVESKIFGILTHFAYFEYIVTRTEMEALLLECNLIKKYQPRYNVVLRDDKSYPYIHVTVQNEYPKIELSREYRNDGSLFLGPYIGVKKVNLALELVQKIFKLRQCDRVIEKLTKDDLAKGKTTKNQRTCLNYHIGQCVGPCAGKISYEAYNEKVQHALDFLENKQDIQKDILKQLEKDMQAHAKKLEFEEAKELRDTIMGIQLIQEKQLLDKQSKNNQDIIGYYQEDDEVQIEVLEIREGKLLNRQQYQLRGASDEKASSFLGDFILQHYVDGMLIPNEIVLQSEIEDEKLITKWLTDIKKRRVYITVPQKGDKKRLVEMAEKNAKITLENKAFLAQTKEDKVEEILHSLQEILALDFYPKRMEAYDISNMQGVYSVGSMVVYENTLSKRSEYRKFNIKNVEGANDYASIQEVIQRRFVRFLENDSGFENKPDIVFVDGGKPQVGAANEVLETLGILMPVVGMVKDDKHQTNGLLYEETFYPLDRQTNLYKFIAGMQAEVHRFAIDFHRKRRTKGMVHSVLDEIDGIGPKRRQSIITHFQNIEAVKKASVEELANIPSMNQKAAKAVVAFFEKEGKE